MTLEIRAVNVNTGATTVLPPTNSPAGEDALCTSNGTAGHDGHGMNTVIATGVQLPAGNYRLQGWARTVNGGTGWLNDTSLVVWR